MTTPPESLPLVPEPLASTPSRPLGLKKRVAFAALAAIVALGGATLAARAKQETAPVEPGPIERRVIARAAVTPIDGVSEIRAEIEGRVVEVFVREGDRVSAGQRLAELDAAQLDLALARAEAEVGVLEAELAGLKRGGRREVRRELAAIVDSSRLEAKLAREEALRQAELEALEAVPRSARDHAVTAAEVADARLAAAQARLAAVTRGAVPEAIRAAEHRIAAAVATRDDARRARARATLVAPVSGVILARRIDRGDVVDRTLGPALFEIAEPNAVELRAEVEERHAALVSAGAPVTVTALGGTPVLGRGTVHRVGARVQPRAIPGDPSEVRADSLIRPLYITLDEHSALGLPIGQRVEVDIALQPEQVAARIPRRALALRDGELRVQVSRGLFRESIPVELGATDARFVEVRGLEPNARVVLRDEH